MLFRSDCHGHTSPQADGGPTASADAAAADPHSPNGHAAGCGSCDICHSQVTTDTASEWRSPVLGLTLCTDTRWTFDSAHALPCFKPPRA